MTNFGANCCCFGCTESIADGFDWMRSQGHPLDVKVKQNKVNISILFYNFSDSNSVIYLFILEVCFCNVLDCSVGLTSQCQGSKLTFARSPEASISRGG